MDAGWRQRYTKRVKAFARQRGNAIASLGFRYTFDVDYSDDKDRLMTGETVSGTRRVIVEAPNMTEGALIAEEMVAARGWEPTECRAVDWTDGP
jgi:hypothetical protein